MDGVTTDRIVKNKMKNFFTKISHDPYVDWLIVLMLGTIGIIIAAASSVVVYKNNTDTVENTATTTKAVSIDVKKLDYIVDVLHSRKPAVIDVRDPSL